MLDSVVAVKLPVPFIWGISWLKVIVSFNVKIFIGVGDIAGTFINLLSGNSSKVTWTSSGINVIVCEETNLRILGSIASVGATIIVNDVVLHIAFFSEIPVLSGVSVSDTVRILSAWVGVVQKHLVVFGFTL